MYREISDDRIAEVDLAIEERIAALTALREEIARERIRSARSFRAVLARCTWAGYAGAWVGAIAYCISMQLALFPAGICAGAAISAGYTFLRRHG